MDGALVELAAQLHGRRGPLARDDLSGVPGRRPPILPQTLFGMVQQIDCTITSDRAVLVSAGGTICTIEPEDTEGTLLAGVWDSDTAMSGFSIAVDGRLLADIDAHRSLTQPFDIELLEDSLFGMPAGTVRVAWSGRVALLSDLAPGTHTIVLRDEMGDPTRGTLAATTIVTIEVTE
jgi:hypothetical protein